MGRTSPSLQYEEADLSPAGLTDRVIKVLHGEGIDVKVTREEAVESLSLDIITPAMKPRDYQARCVEAALSHGRGILELATGREKPPSRG